MSLLRIKIGIIVLAALGTLMTVTFSTTPVSTAKSDDILTEIAGYRSWTRINKDPIVVQPTPSTFSIDVRALSGGWTFIVDGVPGLGTRGKPDPDLVSIAGNLGKRIGSLFKSGKKTETTSANNSIELLRTTHDSGLSVGVVYANEKARTSIYSDSPSFPVGSIIVRERHDEELKPLPNKVIAMVKRDAGFTPSTGDWEFFMLDGRTLAMQLRETTGTCATCHVQAKATDWSFRTSMGFKR